MALQAGYAEAATMLLGGLQRLLLDDLISCVVYGSAARGRARAASDLDVLLEFEARLSSWRCHRSMTGQSLAGAYLQKCMGSPEGPRDASHELTHGR
ncbi:MAG TPA: nucleotidyltransferase domain-containing protein [Polyangiaceae bacterium]|jgi:predicted nucleotidyltransferase